MAARLFGERGYYGTTTADLAAGAGVTEPILYRHFASKLDLFVSLIDEVGARVLAAWREQVEVSDDPVERLHLLLSTNPVTQARGRGVYRVICQAMTAHDGEPAIAEASRRHLAALRDFLRREIAALQRVGVVRSDEPDAVLASLLMSSIIGYGMIASIVPPPGGRARMQELLTELLAG